MIEFNYSKIDKDEFQEAIENSLFLSNHEKKYFSNLDDKPLYLINALFNALKEENDYLNENPLTFEYLHKLDDWVKNKDKTIVNFPGILKKNNELINVLNLFTEKEKEFFYKKLVPSDYIHLKFEINESINNWNNFLSLCHDKNLLTNLSFIDLNYLIINSLAFSVVEKITIIKNLSKITDSENKELLNLLKSENKIYKEIEFYKENDSFIKNNQIKIGQNIAKLRTFYNNSIFSGFNFDFEKLLSSKIDNNESSLKEYINKNPLLISNTFEEDFLINFSLNEIIYDYNYPQNIKVPENNLNFDEKKFIELFEKSLSLTIEEKIQIIKDIPKLSQFQIDELIKILEEEKLKFSELKEHHPQHVNELEKTSHKEWNYSKFFNLDIKFKNNIIKSCEFIHKIEFLLSSFKFEKVFTIISNLLEEEINLFPLWEFFIQSIISMGKNLKSEIENIFNLKTISEELREIILLNSELMLLNEIDYSTLNRKISESKGIYKCLYLYLLSKYYLFVCKDVIKGLEFAEKALFQELNNNSFVFAFIFNHYIRSLIISDNFQEVDKLFKIIFPLEKLPLNFEFIRNIYSLDFNSENKEDERKLLEFINKVIYEYSNKDQNLNNILNKDFIINKYLYNEQLSKNSIYENAKKIILQVQECGLVNELYKNQDFEIAKIINENSFDQALKFIEDLINNSNPNEYRFIELNIHKHSLLRKNGINILEKELEKVGNIYYEFPNAINGAIYLNILFNLSEFKSNYQIESTCLNLSQEIQTKFYFIPLFNEYLFNVKHYIFVEKKDKECSFSTQNCLSFGISKSIFNILSIIKRWEGSHKFAIILSILDGILFSNSFSIAIISTLKLSLYHEGISLFLISNYYYYSNELFNNFALGFETEILGIIFLRQSMNNSWNIKECNVTFINSSNTFLHNKLYKFSLYRALLNLWISPNSTWGNYYSILDASFELKLKKIYIPAYIHGKKVKTPDLDEKHLSKLQSYLKEFIKIDYVNLNEEKNYIYLTFLAKSIIDEIYYIHNELNVSVPVHIAFDILIHIENLKSQDKILENEFLFEESNKLFTELVLDDLFLLYKYPNKNFEEKYKYKVDLLKNQKSEDDFYNLKLDSIVDEWTQSGFVSALTGGRVNHNYSKTIKDSISKIYPLVDTLKTLTKDIKPQPLIEEKKIISNINTDFIQVLRNTLSNKNTDLIEEKKIISKHYEIKKEIFKYILKSHVLEDSEMFQSFRTRIRHGWLTSSITDCFARFDLYNEGSDEILPIKTKTILNSYKLDEEEVNEIKESYSDLKILLINIIEKLDRDWLWLRDNEHPEGMLNFSLDSFDINEIFENIDIINSSLETIICHICECVDNRVIVCFKDIQKLIDEKIRDSLLERIKNIEQIFKNLQDKHKNNIGILIKDSLKSAKIEFKKRIEDYKSWFNFQDYSVRDFHIIEIINKAWEISKDINFNIKYINEPLINDYDGARNIYLKGKNFDKLLEIFKILFQNVIEHSNPSKNSNISIKIDLKIKKKDNNRIIICNFKSTSNQEFDMALIQTLLTNYEKIIVKKKNTGLATIKDFTRNRLDGIDGDVSVEEINKYLNVRITFCIKEIGNKPEINFENKIENKIENLMQSIKNKDTKIVIADDQLYKFQKIKECIDDLLPNSGVINLMDLETTSRFLIKYKDEIDLLILDMTMPIDPQPNSKEEGFGGLTILKLMKDHNINKIQTIVVTQYSNWRLEAYQDQRIFIEELNSYKKEYNFFLGAVRFSHSDLSWKKNLKDLLSEDVMEEKMPQIPKKVKEGINLKHQKYYKDSMLSTLARVANSFVNEFIPYVKDIKNLSNVSINRIKETDHSLYIKFKENVIDEVNRVENLILNLKYLSHETKSSDFIDINNVIGKVFNNLQIDLEQSNIKYKFNLEKDLPSIYGDSLKLEQAITNIISNSIDSLNEMPETYIKNIECETSLKFFEDDKFIFIDFIDNGLGLSVKDKDRIFEQFFTTKSSGKGTGLGLTYSNDIIRLHGGYIKLISFEKGNFNLRIEIPLYNNNDLSKTYIYTNPISKSTKNLFNKKVEHLDILTKNTKSDLDRILSQSSSFFERITSEFGHNFRQPLHIIRYAVSSIISKLNENMLDIKMNLDKIIKYLDLIESKIELFRIFINSSETKQFVDINSIITQTTNLLKIQFEHININLILGNDIPNIYVNLTNLKLAFVNLLFNSIDSLDKVNISNKKITLKTYLDKNNIIIIIEDNGIGIDEDIKEQIFDPYVTTNSYEYGRGLGLTITKEIFLSMFGDINLVYNDFGNTVFKVSIPLLTKEIINEE